MAKRWDSIRVRFTARSIWHALLLTLIAMVGGALLAPTMAYAAPHTGNYQLDVQVTNGPFSYGGSIFPNFQATLTALNGATLASCTGSTSVTLSVDSDPGTIWAATAQSASGTDTCVYTYIKEPPNWSEYATGLRTATVQATISGQVVATGTVTFMVNKVVTRISCGVNTGGTVYQVGSTLQIEEQVYGPDTNYTPDWTQSKFDVSFTGPANMTYTNLTPDTTPGTGWLYVKAPTIPGFYHMTCTFDGYGDYAPSTSGEALVEMSTFHQIGGIKLYTTPTTYNPHQTCNMYIVVQAAHGGPTPTGTVAITIGPNYTPLMNIASNGTLSVRLNALPLPGEAGNQISVDYQGDFYYHWGSSDFSFTNPAIPGNAPPTSGSGVGSTSSGSGANAGSPQATTTATVLETTSSPTMSSVDTQRARAGLSASGSSGGSPILWIGLGLLALGLGGGAIALVVRARLAKTPFGVPIQTPYTSGWSQPPEEPPFSPPAGG